jgi:Flp pilus assembly protein TadD
MKPQKDRPTRRWKTFAVCIFLALITWLVFGQTRHFRFVNFDDNEYVYQNPHVTPGMTFDGIVWAFTHSHAVNWHPLTTISHLLDCRLYGLKAGGHHLTNVLLHMVSVILLFLVLQRMTAAFWLSAFVAAVFAIHPLHVESVAWVSERKDVLSGLFFMLTLGAYARYVRMSQVRGKKSGLILVLFFFALGLMSKPMLVTLPFVLLLLDYWPLSRFSLLPAEPVFRLGGYQVPRRLIVEKIPLLGLAVLSCMATLLAQRGAIQSFEHFSLPLRLVNAVESAAIYLWQMIYPVGLAVFYPYPANCLAPWKVALAMIVLDFISAGAFVLRHRRPYLLVGWLWYLIMLVPVIGIVQVGTQPRADRYTYLPQIGLYILIAWAARDLFASWRHRRWVLGVSAALVITLLAASARTQTSYWRNTESLWTHTLACTSRNNVALTNLGMELLETGRVEEAMADLQKALEINSNDWFAHNSLGKALVRKGRVDEAITHFRKTVELNPKLAEAYNNLGSALLQNGQAAAAIAQYQKALEINPEHAGIHNNLGLAYSQNGAAKEGMAEYEKALEINPQYADAQNNLAWTMATGPEVSLRNGNKAIELAEKADQLSKGGDPNIAGTLAAAYAEAGRFSEAITTVERAMQLATVQKNTAMVDALQIQIKAYKAGIPFRDTGQTNARH